MDASVACNVMPVISMLMRATAPAYPLVCSSIFVRLKLFSSPVLIDLLPVVV